MRLERNDPVATLLDEAQASFDAWREKNDPQHLLSMEEACARYDADQHKR